MDSRSIPRANTAEIRGQHLPIAIQAGRQRRAGGALRRYVQQPFPAADRHCRPGAARSGGCAVELPAKHVCCGRPYYDYGMLKEAKHALEGVLEVLAPQLEAGAPVVVLEPGCLSVFRDELRQLMPDDPREIGRASCREWRRTSVGG